MNTAWEIGIYKNGKLIEALDFSERKTKSVLWATARENAALIEQLASDEDLGKDVLASREFVRFGSVSIEWTGRTYLDNAR